MTGGCRCGAFACDDAELARWIVEIEATVAAGNQRGRPAATARRSPGARQAPASPTENRAWFVPPAQPPSRETDPTSGPVDHPYLPRAETGCLTRPPWFREVQHAVRAESGPILAMGLTDGLFSECDVAWFVTFEARYTEGAEDGPDIPALGDDPKDSETASDEGSFDEEDLPAEGTFDTAYFTYRIHVYKNHELPTLARGAGVGTASLLLDHEVVFLFRRVEGNDRRFTLRWGWTTGDPKTSEFVAKSGSKATVYGVDLTLTRFGTAISLTKVEVAYSAAEFEADYPNLLTVPFERLDESLPWSATLRLGIDITEPFGDFITYSQSFHGSDGWEHGLEDVVRAWSSAFTCYIRLPDGLLDDTNARIGLAESASDVAPHLSRVLLTWASQYHAIPVAY